MSRSLLPDWNSLQAVRSAHSALEGAALIFFALLVLFDVLAHMYEKRDESRSTVFERIALICFGIAVLMELVAYPYSRRNDLLSDQENARQRDRIAVLDNSTQQLKTEAQIAHKQAEDEAAARVKIEAAVAWRHLTDNQQKGIGAEIGRRYSNQGVSLWYNASDTEASWFAADIAGALLAAHTLRVYPPAGILKMTESGRLNQPIMRIETGVILQSTKDDLSRSLADAIIRELKVRGFDAVRETDPPFDPNPAPQVWVNVEPRPNGPQGEYKLAAEKRPR